MSSLGRLILRFLVVPFGAVHQHFNTGPTTARYFSAMSVHLEHFCGLHRHTQLAERGTTITLPSVPASPNGFDALGRRIHLLLADAEVLEEALGFGG